MQNNKFPNQRPPVETSKLKKKHFNLLIGHKTQQKIVLSPSPQKNHHQFLSRALMALTTLSPPLSTSRQSWFNLCKLMLQFQSLEMSHHFLHWITLGKAPTNNAQGRKWFMKNTWLNPRANHITQDYMVSQLREDSNGNVKFQEAFFFILSKSPACTVRVEEGSNSHVHEISLELNANYSGPKKWLQFGFYLWAQKNLQTERFIN